MFGREETARQTTYPKRSLPTQTAFFIVHILQSLKKKSGYTCQEYPIFRTLRRTDSFFILFPESTKLQPSIRGFLKNWGICKSPWLSILSHGLVTWMIFSHVSTHQQMKKSVSWGPQTIAKFDCTSNFTGVFWQLASLQLYYNYTITMYSYTMYGVFKATSPSCRLLWWGQRSRTLCRWIWGERVEALVGLFSWGVWPSRIAF